MPEINITHLEFTQAVIARMNSNSFHIKGWNITIVAAFLAMFASTKNELFILVSIFPVVVFWLLDTYYLTKERKFRGLYEDIAGISENSKDLKKFEMRPNLYVGGKYSYINVFKSPSIILLYLPLVIFLFGAFVYLQLCN